MSLIKAIYISDISLQSANGGSRAMRALFNDSRIEVLELTCSENNYARSDGFLERVISRVVRTRFGVHFGGLHRRLIHRRLPETIVGRAREFKTDVVVSVVHGASTSIALNLAKKLEVPFISIFHDWWPFVVTRRNFVASADREWMESVFRRIHRDSTIAYYVCPGMMEELEGHPNGHVLYPLPNESDDCGETESRVVIHTHANVASKPRFVVTYTGDIGYGYGEMLRRLARNLKGGPVALKVFGKPTGWKPEEVEEMEYSGILLPPVPFAEYFNTLRNSDALLTVSSFEEYNQIYSRTSLPSKIISYLQVGRPLVFWGPPASSVARFATEFDAGIIHTEFDGLSQRLLDLANDIGQTKVLENKAITARDRLSPSVIRDAFYCPITDHLTARQQ